MKQAKPGRLISVLLMLTMVFSLCGMTVFAAEYGVQINTGATGNTKNTWVSDSNAADILEDGGSVSYDAAANTLTLNNANLSYEGSGNSIIYAPNNKDLIINLIGTNTMRADQCIFVTGTLTITGEGSLTADGVSYAVAGLKGLTVDGTKVSANTTGNSSAAILSSQGIVTIQNGATVEATSTNKSGISGTNGVTVTVGSIVKAFAQNSEYDAALAASSGEIKIENSTVTAASANAAGISTNGNITITDSAVEATSEFPGTDDFGIYAIGGNNVSISGGTVTAVSTGKGANAICAWDAINISNDAVVTAKAENSASYPSIFAENSVSISGGQVTTISGGDAGIFTPGSVSITDGSDVDASGYWPAIRGNTGVTMTGSTVAAESSNDVAIYSPQNVSIADSIVEAKGVEGANGIKANGAASSNGSWISTSGAETFEGGIANSVLINGTKGTVVGDAVIPGDVTIPAGTTLTIPSGASLTVPGNVTLTNQGTVDGEGKVTNNGTVNCATHTGGTATCTQKAVCAVCGKEYGDLLTHSLTKTEKKPAACTQAGHEAYWTCSVCNKLFSDENGTTEIEKPVAIAATGHSYGTSWNYDANGHWHECTVCHGKDAVVAHTFHWVVNKEATAAEKGSKYEECSVCHYKRATVEIPATGSTTTTPASPPSPPDKTTPQTGDTNHLGVYVSLLLVSVIGLGATFAISKKRNCHGKQAK